MNEKSSAMPKYQAYNQALRNTVFFNRLNFIISKVDIFSIAGGRLLIVVIFIVLMLPLILQAADDLIVAGYTHNEALRLGERMYREGILPDGKAMQAVVIGDTTIDGRMFTCVNCHQRSGQGSIEGSVITWPIGANNLFVPRRRTGAWNSKINQKGPGAVQRWSLPSQYQAADARPAFNDETLARVLRTGIDSADHKIMEIMPRYKLNDNDMAVLIYYLKNLSSTPDPGVSDKIIRFATVITEGVSAVDRDAMLSVLQNHIDVHNTQTRPHLRRAKRGPFYKTERFAAYRKLELDVWELKGPEDSWRQQLENYYQARPVFALLGGISKGSWMPVHKFCEENKIPNIFPVTDNPVISDTDWYTLYFNKGLYQEGEAAARFLLKSDQVEKNIVQIFRAGSKGEKIAQAFEKNWPGGDDRDLKSISIKNTKELPLQRLNEMLSLNQATVLLWLDQSDANEVFQAGIFKYYPNEKLFLSTSLLSGETSIIPDDLLNSVFLIHPHSLPVDYDRKSRALKHWLKIRNIPESNLDILAKMYFLGWMLPAAIKNMRNEFYRDYFLEGFDMMTDQTYAVAVYPRLSFGPGQRYAAKGCYVAQLRKDETATRKMAGDWIVN